jgi:coenzyme PQQ precursor peptide PqqA
VHDTLVLLPLHGKYGPLNVQPGVSFQFVVIDARNRLAEEKMVWSAPRILEISCGMEINRYAPADDTDPIQF